MKLPAEVLKETSPFEDNKVFIVDGHYLRDNVAIEFTNFAYHEIRPYVPPGEIWIDRENNHREFQLFLETIRLQKIMLGKGISFPKAEKISIQIEILKRHKIPEVMALFHLSHEEQVKRVKIRSLVENLSNGISVILVNGFLVRSLFYPDFTEGGHHLRYSFIPYNEIWIDDSLDEEEFPAIILHETTERNLMSESNLPYEEAHKISSRVESEYRQKSQ